jgi:hypothetical protein
MNILNALKIEQNKLQRKLEGIKAAIAALGGKRGKTTRTMSAATRRRISATQKKNWAEKRTKRK